MYSVSRTGCALCMLFLCLVLPVSRAQDSQHLRGPLVVTTTNTHSGFILFDLTTHEERHLSFGEGTHILGGFSPDGCQIVFVWEQQPDYYDLFTAHLDGTHLRQIMFLGRTGALNYRVWEPSWSPDGSRIVFTLIRYYNPADEDPYRTTHIAWVSPDGGPPSFYSTSGTEWHPRWSPDGQFVAYVSEQPLSDNDEAEPKPEIWITQADGQYKFRLTNFAEGPAYNPRWSPDGRWVGFVHEPVSGNHRVMAMAADGSSSPQTLSAGLATVLDFTWWPDSQGVTAAMQGWREVPQNVLWNLGLDGQSALLVGEANRQFLDFPRYSPDGRWLAFRQAYELVIYDAQENIYHAFGEASHHNGPPIWTPIGFRGEQSCPP